MVQTRLKTLKLEKTAWRSLKTSCQGNKHIQATLTNHDTPRQSNEPIRTKGESAKPAKSAGNSS